MLLGRRSNDEIVKIKTEYDARLTHKQLVRSIPRLSAPSCHPLGKINAMGTFFFIRHLCLYDGNHRCLVGKNVPIAFIFPSRWQDGAESLGTETTSCLWAR